MNQNSKELLMLIFDAAPHQRGTESLCAYSDALDGYIDSELDQGIEAANTRFPGIKAHLSECCECQEVYDDLKAVVQARREAPFVQPIVEPQFDFSYLEKDSIWQVVLRGRKQVMELFTKITIVLSDGKALFSQLPSPLTVEWGSAPVRIRMRDRSTPVPLRERGKSAQEERVPLLSLLSKEHDLSLRLCVTPPESDQKEPTLIVEVISLSSPQSRIRAKVTLRDAQYHHLESDSTHKEGHVRFVNLKPADYVIDIKYQGRVWQVPITLTWS